MRYNAGGQGEACRVHRLKGFEDVTEGVKRMLERPLAEFRKNVSDSGEPRRF